MFDHGCASHFLHFGLIGLEPFSPSSCNDAKAASATLPPPHTSMKIEPGDSAQEFQPAANATLIRIGRS